jgi:hypothetical protein
MQKVCEANAGSNIGEFVVSADAHEVQAVRVMACNLAIGPNAFNNWSLRFASIGGMTTTRMERIA